MQLQILALLFALVLKVASGLDCSADIENYGTVSWTISDDDWITIEVEVDTIDVWLGFGFGSQMIGSESVASEEGVEPGVSDLIINFKSINGVRVMSDTMTIIEEQFRDVVDGTKTKFGYKRPLESPLLHDKEIVVGVNDIIWAIGNGPTLGFHSLENRGIDTIDLQRSCGGNVPAPAVPGPSVSEPAPVPDVIGPGPAPVPDIVAPGPPVPPVPQPAESPTISTDSPTDATTDTPIDEPTNAPTDPPPTNSPTDAVTDAPTDEATEDPTDAPKRTRRPTDAPLDPPAEPTVSQTEASTEGNEWTVLPFGRPCLDDANKECATCLRGENRIRLGCQCGVINPALCYDCSRESEKVALCQGGTAIPDGGEVDPTPRQTPVLTQEPEDDEATERPTAQPTDACDVASVQYCCTPEECFCCDDGEHCEPDFGADSGGHCVIDGGEEPEGEEPAEGGCGSHEECGDDKYCGLEGECASCESCWYWADPFDGVCPCEPGCARHADCPSEEYCRIPGACASCTDCEVERSMDRDCSRCPEEVTERPQGCRADSDCLEENSYCTVLARAPQCKSCDECPRCDVCSACAQCIPPDVAPGPEPQAVPHPVPEPVPVPTPSTDEPVPAPLVPVPGPFVPVPGPYVPVPGPYVPVPGPDVPVPGPLIPVPVPAPVPVPGPRVPVPGLQPNAPLPEITSVTIDWFDGYVLIHWTLTAELLEVAYDMFLSWYTASEIALLQEDDWWIVIRMVEYEPGAEKPKREEFKETHEDPPLKWDGLDNNLEYTFQVAVTDGTVDPEDLDWGAIDESERRSPVTEGSKKKDHTLAIVLGVILPVLFIVALVVAYCCWKKKKDAEPEPTGPGPIVPEVTERVRTDQVMEDSSSDDAVDIEEDRRRGEVELAPATYDDSLSGSGSGDGGDGVEARPSIR